MGLGRSISADEKAEKLVWEKLNIEFGNLYLDPDEETYADELRVFKLLFSQEHEDYKMALWNALEVNLKHTSLKKDDFTENEYAFLLRFDEARRNRKWPEHTNINKPIRSNRLLLRPTNGLLDLQLYEEHLEKDGDFTLFTNLKFTKYNVQRFGFDRPFFFVIEERITGHMIGYVGVRWEKTNGQQTQVMECEYYIFKPYRHNGYATEALKVLCQQAFAEKLFELVNTNYDYIYRRKRAKPLLIRAMIREDNEGSCALVESCGFERTGVLHRHFWVENKYAVDCIIYELAKNIERVR